MSIFKEIIEELRLNDEQLKDKEIQRFVFEVLARKKSNDWVQFWDGNGYCEINKNDGTLITTVLNDNEEFEAEFPLNCDMNISLRCENGCAFCYEGCTKNGKEADIKKYINDKNSFLYSLHEGTELALNGNEPLHKDLNLLLDFCKDRNIFANLTVNENTLLKHKQELEQMLDNRLIHGIGISPTTYSNEMIEFCKSHSTAVIHTIAGITTKEQYEKLMDKDLKILILGYKTFGKGIQFKSEHDESIRNNINDLKLAVSDYVNHFKVVSFDNLAIEQLNPRSFLTEKQWNEFYRGDDGHHTLYIDLVNETFAKNSIQARTNHKPLMNDIRDMLKEVKSK